MQLQFHAAPAIASLQRWEQYVEGHQQVLKKFGVDELTSTGRAWIQNPNVRLITAVDERGEVVGGVKLHGYHPDFPLPAEPALLAHLPDTDSFAPLNRQYGLGEICGLWTAARVSRIGLAHFLTRAAIALCEPLRIRRIVGICSPLTLRNALTTGYERWTEVGENGNFAYPTPQITSTAVFIADAWLLPTAQAAHRQRILDLRQRPSQTFVEVYAGVETEIRYDLSRLIRTDSGYELLASERHASSARTEQNRAFS